MQSTACKAATPMVLAMQTLTQAGGGRAGRESNTSPSVGKRPGTPPLHPPIGAQELRPGPAGLAKATPGSHWAE
jgi:hypothetical protein